jgi:hypothetical protein
MAKLIPTRAPALPLAENSYTRAFKDRYSNILRLYFNQIDGIIQALLGTDGGQYLQLAHISAVSTSNQYATGDDVPTQVTWGTVGSNSGFTILSGTATANAPGVYRMDYDLQLANTDSAQHEVFVWFQANGSEIVNSSRRFTVPASGFVTACSSVQIELNIDDEIKVWWATDKAYSNTGPVDGVYMEALTAQTLPYVRPANPSAVGSIVYVSRLP